MKNFAKALVLALMFAAPVAISVPAVQAQTIHSTRVKATKIHKHRHHRRPVHNSQNLVHKFHK